VILIQNCISSEQKSKEVATMKTFATLDKAKRITGNKRWLNLAAVMPKNVQYLIAAVL
jgi:hypothetical protein